MNLLLVEDDLNLCDAIKQHLSEEGFVVDVCNTGDDAFMYAFSPDHSYDLAIIDRMLPVMDGLSLIKAMRRKNIQTPIIVITGMSELNDRIEGLDCGADDYLVKPFHIQELSARIRALLRRSPQLTEDTILHFEDISLNLANQQLCCNDISLLLTAKEFHLISAFLSAPGTICSREQLLQKAWGTAASIEPGNVDNYIYFLRKRLKQLNSRCRIRSIYGSGYILEAADDKKT